MTAHITFAVSHISNDLLDDGGVAIVAERDSVRAGRIIEVRLPEGTVDLGRTSGPGGYGQYTYSQVRRYRLPDGRIIRAGGGGPSDADTIEIEMQS